MARVDLRASKLSFAYPDGTHSLEGCDLVVREREKWALIGPNGAGKTTLLLLADGLLRPASGAIEVLGSALSNPREMVEIRKRVGFLFQNPDDQLFCTTVLEEVLFGPLNHDLPPEVARARADAALRSAGLEGYEKRVPQHLSGGEKRKVAVASVLSMEPELLLFDEPTNDLDPRGRVEILQLLENMPLTMLIATHDYELVLRVCSHVALMNRGRVAASGPADKILADKELLEAGGLVQPEWLPYLLKGNGAVG
ncbi:MAG: ABC transporter ATP-binding protein [Candidatus Omnitrophica bacterium]|nr:ABC transporter ATP-binding protein [Candidatus Omnitrophota bacterium]